MWRRYRNTYSSEPNKFFYVTRKTGDVEQINLMYLRLNRDTKTIINNIIQLVYFMRGAMEYNNVIYSMSFIERDMAMSFVNDRLEQEGKNPHPVY